MRDRARQDAQQALIDVGVTGREEVLALLASSRPEAVLAAVEAWYRHRNVVEGLLQRQPPVA